MSHWLYSMEALKSEFREFEPKFRKEVLKLLRMERTAIEDETET